MGCWYACRKASTEVSRQRLPAIAALYPSHGAPARKDGQSAGWPERGERLNACVRTRLLGAGDHLSLFPDTETDTLVATFEQQIRIKHDLVALQFAEYHRGIRYIALQRARDPGDGLGHRTAAEITRGYQPLLPMGACAQP